MRADCPICTVHPQTLRQRVARGFTLVELMVVVAVIGVLAAIAYPNYQDYLMKSRINEATAGLSDMRVKMEQFFQDNRTYANACATGALAQPPTNTKFFDFTCLGTCNGVTASPTQTQYCIKATGKSSMSGFDYTVTETNTRATTVSAGAQTATGWAGNTACWVTNKGGGC